MGRQKLYGNGFFPAVLDNQIDVPPAVLRDNFQRGAHAQGTAYITDRGHEAEACKNAGFIGIAES